MTGAPRWADCRGGKWPSSLLAWGSGSSRDPWHGRPLVPRGPGLAPVPMGLLGSHLLPCQAFSSPEGAGPGTVSWEEVSLSSGNLDEGRMTGAKQGWPHEAPGILWSAGGMAGGLQQVTLMDRWTHSILPGVTLQGPHSTPPVPLEPCSAFQPTLMGLAHTVAIIVHVPDLLPQGHLQWVSRGWGSPGASRVRQN